MAQIILDARPGVIAGDISERCRPSGVSLPTLILERFSRNTVIGVMRTVAAGYPTDEVVPALVERTA